MIKAALIAIPLVIILNLIAVGGFVGWLYQSGRLNQERVQRVVAMFKPTIAQEQRALTEAEAAAAEAEVVAQENARKDVIKEGGNTLSQMFEQDAMRTSIGTEMRERLKQESSQLQTQMRLFKSELDRQQAELDDARKAFEAEVQSQIDRVEDEDFQQVIQTLEKLKPIQVKSMVTQMIQEGRTETAVEYLAAMNVGKSSAVLGQFTAPNEVEVLTDLVRRLDERRRKPLAGVAGDVANVGGAQ